MTTTPLATTLILDEVEVVSAERLSPSFVRIVLGGPALADFGVVGPTYDQRFKIVFPPENGVLPSFAGADDSWFATWLDIPAEERGTMRTYTIREVRGSGDETQLVVDIVVHEGHDDAADGPGSAWALTAKPGDRVIVLAPRRGVPFGGIEFDPGTATDLLLVGDETAVPAIASILAQLPASARGTVFLEVPTVEDLQLLPAPERVDVRWLPRAGAEPGARLIPDVRRHLGLGETPGSRPEPLAPGEEDVWETPTYSAAGEDLGADVAVERYAWIAGESTVVRTLRRTLVAELGWDRHAVAFMGYWRQGVAMRS